MRGVVDRARVVRDLWPAGAEALQLREAVAGADESLGVSALADAIASRIDGGADERAQLRIAWHARSDKTLLATDLVRPVRLLLRRARGEGRSASRWRRCTFMLPRRQT